MIERIREDLEETHSDLLSDFEKLKEVSQKLENKEIFESDIPE